MFERVCDTAVMREHRRYFGLDHPRLVLTLLRTLVHQGSAAMATANTELGLDVHRDGPGSDVRETLLSAVQLLAAVAQDNAAATGRTLEDVVDELSIKLEVANIGTSDCGNLTPRGHGRPLDADADDPEL